MSIIVCGIDPSITGTAICHGTSETDWSIERMGAPSMGEGAAARVHRYERLMEQIVHHVGAIKPDVCFIEDYSFHSKFNREYMGELGIMIRWHVLDLVTEENLYEVAPKCLKKFVTGKGNADKNQMGQHIALRTGRTFPTDDHVDSMGLYFMALAAIGVSPAKNKDQRDAVATVIGDRPLKLEPQVTDVASAPVGPAPF